ncbi:MAG: hypothetical protein H7A32_01650 [Deltaproteobacteria bacterium]|nr:hypothetical protein [Deltaproteobacteria bacterium]
MSPKKKLRARYFYVVGGGCFGTQYATWLLRAQRLGLVEFEKIFAIDQNPHCQLSQIQIAENQSAYLEIIQSDWISYLTDLLIRSCNDPAFSQDHWVPSPLSPHILLLAFMRAAMQKNPGLRLQEKAFSDNFFEKSELPVSIFLESGQFAASFAEWICPVNCIEPKTCPAIHLPRHWDMKTSLENYFRDLKVSTSAHVLQCQHRVHGVGTILFSEIQSHFASVLDQFKKGVIRELIVATVSSCHGLIGRAQLL